jgi:FKBP-type peptidyl-prolyl cis-trans isomerase SlyD
MAPTVQEGTTVQLDYTLTVDGEVVDSSKGHGPLSYVHGQGQLIPGLEKQLVGLKAGDARSISVGPEEGYGLVDPEAFVEVSREQLPLDIAPEAGQALRGTGPDGRPFRATIFKVGSEKVTLDLNHPLAGKTLFFDITVVNVSPGKAR